MEKSLREIREERALAREENSANILASAEYEAPKADAVDIEEDTVEEAVSEEPTLSLWGKMKRYLFGD